METGAGKHEGEARVVRDCGFASDHGRAPSAMEAALAGASRTAGARADRLLDAVRGIVARVVAFRTAAGHRTASISYDVVADNYYGCFQLLSAPSFLVKAVDDVVGELPDAAAPLEGGRFDVAPLRGVCGLVRTGWRVEWA